MKHLITVFIVLFCLFGILSCDKPQQQVLIENLSLPKEDHRNGQSYFPVISQQPNWKPILTAL